MEAWKKSCEKLSFCGNFFVWKKKKNLNLTNLAAKKGGEQGEKITLYFVFIEQCCKYSYSMSDGGAVKCLYTYAFCKQNNFCQTCTYYNR